MAYHFIAISSSYVAGTRIAWHYSSEDKLDPELIQAFMKEAQEQNSLQFGIHKLSTPSTSWESVIEKDSFFEDILAMESYSDFLTCVSDDKIITAEDVAKLVLSIIPMSHLKLQKIVYLIYSEYLLNFGESLFSEKIIAYQYGPVVEELYQMYKKYHREVIRGPKAKIKKTSVPPLMMKILASDNGEQILQTVVEVLGKYGQKRPGALVSLTHSKDSPWDKAYEAYMNKEITDDLIRKYHANEVLV